MDAAEDVAASFDRFCGNVPFAGNVRTAKTGVLHVGDSSGRLPTRHRWVEVPSVVDGAAAHFGWAGCDVFAATAHTTRA